MNPQRFLRLGGTTLMLTGALGVTGLLGLISQASFSSTLMDQLVSSDIRSPDNGYRIVGAGSPAGRLYSRRLHVTGAPR